VRAASTVLLLRDRDAGGYEVFMVRRHQASSFMGGAYVFPGGKLDVPDCDSAWPTRLEGLSPSALERLGEHHEADAVDEDTARGLFVAGVRETLEEAGVLPGTDLDQATVTSMRKALLQGMDLSTLLSHDDVRLDLTDMVPLSRWITPAQEPRRFDTRFFVVRSPGTQRAEHDRTETTDQAWWSPEEALEAYARGEIQLPPPTARSLLQVRDFESADAVIAHARTTPAPRLEPVLTKEQGLLGIALPGDPRHPRDTPAFEGPTRMVLEADALKGPGPMRANDTPGLGGSFKHKPKQENGASQAKQVRIQVEPGGL